MTAVVRRRKRPEAYYSTIGGLTYGWDVCGECARHVSVCTCPSPSEPRWMSAERTPADPPISDSRPASAA